jgi:hypothetical protein
MVLSPILVVVVPSSMFVLATQNSELIYEFLVYATYYCSILSYKVGEVISCVVGCIAGSR